MKLFELIPELELLDQELEEAGGELSPELEKKFEKLTRNRDDMIDYLLRGYNRSLAYLEMAETEKRRIEYVRKCYSNKCESYKRKIASLVKPGNKHRHLFGTISGRISEELKLDPAVEIDPEFCKLVPDKTFIKNAIKDGVSVTGAKIEEIPTVTIRRNPKAKEGETDNQKLD